MWVTSVTIGGLSWYVFRVEVQMLLHHLAIIMTQLSGIPILSPVLFCMLATPIPYVTIAMTGLGEPICC